MAKFNVGFKAKIYVTPERVAVMGTACTKRAHTGKNVIVVTITFYTLKSAYYQMPSAP